MEALAKIQLSSTSTHAVAGLDLVVCLGTRAHRVVRVRARVRSARLALHHRIPLAVNPAAWLMAGRTILSQAVKVAGALIPERVEARNLAAQVAAGSLLDSSRVLVEVQSLADPVAARAVV